MTKTETEVILSQAKGCWQPPETRREAWDRLSLRASRRNQPCYQLDFRLLAFKSTRQSILWYLTTQPRKQIEGAHPCPLPAGKRASGQSGCPWFHCPPRTTRQGRVGANGPFNIWVAQSHGQWPKPPGRAGGRTLSTPSGFSKMKPGVWWWRGPALEGPSPLRLHVVPSCGIPWDRLQSGMLLEGHSQESGRCLVQEPAEFPSVGLD